MENNRAGMQRIKSGLVSHKIGLYHSAFYHGEGMSQPWSHDAYCMWQSYEFALHLCRFRDLQFAQAWLRPKYKHLENQRAQAALNMAKNQRSAADLIDIDDLIQDAFITTQKRVVNWRRMAQNLLETTPELSRIWPDFIALKTIYPLPLNPLIDLFYEMLAQGDCPESERTALLEIVDLLQKAPPSQSLAHTNAPRWHSNWMRSTRSKHLNRRISARNRQIHQDEENTPILDRLPAANPTDTTALYAEAQALLTHLQATPTPCPRCTQTENLATPLKRPLDQALMGHPELWHEPDYGYFRQLKAQVDGKTAPNLIGEKEKGSASERQNLRRFNLRRSALAAYTLAPFDPELHSDSDGFYSALAGAYHQQFPGIEAISITFFKGGQKDNNGVRSGVLWNALWAQHRGISKLYKTHPTLPTLLLQFPSLPRAVTPPKDEGLKAKRITPMR